MTSRINVAVNEETVKVLQAMRDREGVTLTEAVRRLVGYGDVLYAAKVAGTKILLVDGERQREVVVL